VFTTPRKNDARAVIAAVPCRESLLTDPPTTLIATERKFDIVTKRRPCSATPVAQRRKIL